LDGFQAAAKNGDEKSRFLVPIVEFSAFYTPNPLFNFEQVLGNKIRELVAWV
jgi:hypothetical protein